MHLHGGNRTCYMTFFSAFGLNDFVPHVFLEICRLGAFGNSL
jgi:hypothetical protein